MLPSPQTTDPINFHTGVAVVTKDQDEPRQDVFLDPRKDVKCNLRSLFL